MTYRPGYYQYTPQTTKAIRDLLPLTTLDQWDYSTRGVFSLMCHTLYTQRQINSDSQ